MSLDAWSGEGHVDLAVASDPGLERAVVLGWLIRFAACPGVTNRALPQYPVLQIIHYRGRGA